MSIDLDKLARIREQVADLQAGAGALFARYQDRQKSAQDLRRSALANAPAYQGWAMGDLQSLSRGDAEAAGIDFDLLQRAVQEGAIAEMQRAEHDRRRQEQRGVVTLLNRLEEYVSHYALPTFRADRQIHF